MEPTDPAYSDAMTLARVLAEDGISVSCIGPSTMNGLFEGEVGAAIYKTSRGVFEALRNSPASSNTGNPAMAMLGLGSLPNMSTFKDWMDFSLLPPFDKISKYFGFSVYTVSSTPDGILFKMYQPVPAALRK